MACLLSSIYIIILLCFTDIFLQVQSKSQLSDDECLYKIICECQESSEAKTCFDKLKPKVQEFVVDTVNNVCVLETRITDLNQLTTALCSDRVKNAVECLGIIREELGKEAKELISQSDYGNASSIAAFRRCLSPLTKKCKDGDLSCDGKN